MFAIDCVPAERPRLLASVGDHSEVANRYRSSQAPDRFARGQASFHSSDSIDAKLDSLASGKTTPDPGSHQENKADTSIRPAGRGCRNTLYQAVAAGGQRKQLIV